GGIYAGCINTIMDTQCPCTENPFILTSTNFVVGQIYYLVMDGCAGDVCDYSLDLISGSMLGGPPANPGPIAGPTNVPITSTSTYTLAPVVGATDYDWTLTPPLGTFNSNTNTVDVTWTTAGTTNLCVTTSNTCGANPTPSCITITVNSQPPPPNDECPDAESIGCGQSVTGTNQYATADAPGAPNCTGAIFPGVWYSFTGNGNIATVSTCGGASFNTILSVYTGSCGSLTCVNGNDDYCGVRSQVVFPTVNGTTYYILVHGAAGATGTFTLSVDCTAPMPPNGTGTVACPNAATPPTPPTYTSPNCPQNGPITPTGPSTVSSPSPLTCEGTITYTWVYTDCIGVSASWSFEYTIEREPFTGLPANGAATVSCPAQATQPTPPSVVDNCGAAITPTGPTVTESPNPVTCVGTKSYTWTYADCEGNSQTWSFTYTIGPPSFSLPANGGTVVGCPDLTDVVPTPPTVTNSCNTPVAPVLVNVSPKPVCEGERIYTFRYTNCDNTTADWLFIYTVEYQDFILPPNQNLTVDCPSDVGVPMPLPTVYDNCDVVLVPTGPVITNTTSPNGCETGIKYTWTYTDCEGNSHEWSRSYTFDFGGTFMPPANGEAEVSCSSYAIPPIPPVLQDGCGLTITPTGPTVTEDGLGTGCFGLRTYTYLYTDCAGNSQPWSFTYHINNDEPPTGNCPSGLPSTASLDEANLGCIEELPCPDSFDFSLKIAELAALGGFVDVCDGNGINIELDSWSAVWDCEDPDNDGVYTFGRTYYFRISDACGNEFPSLCGITYSGECLPLETFPQAAWGIAGGEPGNSVNPNISDTLMIQGLLDMGPFAIGGTHRSVKVTDATCMVNLLPGIGFSKPLANCHQINCTGGPNGTGCNPQGLSFIKNSLAGNAMALLLNMRYNVKYNGLSMTSIRQQPLDCIEIEPTIVFCANGDEDCILRVVETNGTAHDFPYTIGGLVDLGNLFLDGSLMFNLAVSSNIARDIDKAMNNVNEFWHSASPASCDQGPGSAFTVASQNVIESPAPKIEGTKMELSLVPNPAEHQVNLQVSAMPEPAAVRYVLLNQVGQRVLSKSLGQVDYVNEWIDLSGLDQGIYIVQVEVGNERLVEKLVVIR
ncbi:MAG: T9SS type A sorting domain-containing protein, partial [Saprospiraceae bacterium]|nr:T9SS type A sorting domain-containing protein [Saprospiraceae bacterium]